MNLRSLIGRPQRVRPTVRRVRQLAADTGATSYLEIGVHKGLTFNELEFPAKVAVDPHFLFKPDAFRKQGTEFHEMTSDRYFIEHAASRKFDIVFLDGLHSFEQTLRDFCNSLSCCHERTVWLIDDVWPADVYSALPDWGEAIRYRKQEGRSSHVWHGDVYKVLFAIHDFFPMYSYVTIDGPDNPQALVWKEPRRNFKPVFDSLEKIERLSYFDLHRHADAMNRMAEPEAFATLRTWWRG